MTYKFLIYISYRYSIPIGEPLEAEIYTRGFEVQWFSDEPETFNYLKNKTNVLPTIQDVISYKPDIVLTATDNVPDFINGLKVQVFHGFNSYKRPSKKIIDAHFRIRGFFDLYCTQGPSTTHFFTILKEKHKHFEVIETGWSKVDPLFPIEKKNNKMPEILIATTFTPRLSLALNNEVFEQIQTLSQTGKYHFTMVMHPKLDEVTKNKWKSLQNTNFTFADTVDLIPLFKKSDVLFADTTSVIQEFLLQKKPVVTFNHTQPHNYLIHVSEAKEIEKNINYALTYPQEIIKNIEEYVMKLHPYFDGKSSKRIIDATIKFLHADKSYLKSKPLNLIRKYKIRKKLNYFTLKSFNKPFTIAK